MAELEPTDEALVEELRLIAVWHTPGAKTPTKPMPDVAKVCQMAANALSVSRNCDGISDAREAALQSEIERLQREKQALFLDKIAAEAKGKREGIEEAAKVAEASPYNNGLNDAPSAIARAIRARLGKKP